MTNLNHYISTSTVHMATKLGTMVTYLDKLLPIKSYDPLIMWSCNITWQIKNHYISTIRVPMTTKLNKMVNYLDGLLPVKSYNLCSCGVVRSRDKRKLLYLHYHSAYGHQTSQDGNLLWWAPAYKDTFDHMTLWSRGFMR